MQDVASLRESPAPAARMPRQGPSTEGLRESTTEISAPAGSARKISWFLVRLAIACALLAYLAKSGVIDWRALSRPFTAWPIALAAVALVLVDVSFNALRLSWLFRPHGLNLSWAKSFQVTMISFFFTQFLPGATGGDLARLFYVAKDYKGLRSEIVTVSLLDRAIGMFSLLVMPLLFAPAFFRLIAVTPALRALLVTSAVLAAIILAGFLACLFYQSPMERLARHGFWFSSLEGLAGAGSSDDRVLSPQPRDCALRVPHLTRGQFLASCRDGAGGLRSKSGRPRFENVPHRPFGIHRQLLAFYTGWAWCR